MSIVCVDQPPAEPNEAHLLFEAEGHEFCVSAIRFVNARLLGTIAGRRDQLLAELTQRNEILHELG